MLVCVDLEPVEKGGINGGAKLVALTIMNGLCALGVRLVGFCRPQVYDELSAVLSKKIQLVEILPQESVRTQVGAYEAQNRVRFDLLFFPFTNVSFLSPPARIISIIHDLQYLEHPENFSQSDLGEREAALRNCISRSHTIVTISAFVRRTISKFFPEADGKIKVIYNALTSRLDPATADTTALGRFDLDPLRYFLYPANFWPHKNHIGLLLGYLLYLRENQDPLKLVLVGSDTGPDYLTVKELSSKCGSNEVVLPGYVSDEVLSCLFANAYAVVFPSLYEGFGIPIVEAMRFGKPLAATFEAAIPEIVGNAAVLFDGRRPREIAAALRLLVDDKPLYRRLVRTGRKRLKRIGRQSEMVQTYKEQFLATLDIPFDYRDYAGDVLADGWLMTDSFFSCGPRTKQQEMVIRLFMRKDHPEPSVTVKVETSEDTESHEFVMTRGTRFVVRQKFGPEGGYTRLTCNAAFVPSFLGESDDDRLLCLECYGVTVESADNSFVLFGNSTTERNLDSIEPKPAILLALLRGKIEDVPQLGVIGALTPNGLHNAKVDLKLNTGEVSVRVEAGNASRYLRRSSDAASPSVILPSLLEDEVILVETRGNETCTLEEVRINAAKPLVETICSGSRPIGLPTVYVHTGGQLVSGFSVVTPSYNQGKFIARTIESVLQQKGIVDYYLYDGGSVDETAAVVARYGSQLAFVSEPDRGQADAVNKSLQRGAGEIIAWINSDDTYAPGAFDQVGRIFALHPEVDVIYGEGFHVDEDDNVIERYPTEDFRLSRLLETCFLCQPATFFRRTLLQRFGMLRIDLHFTLDYELWLRFALGGANFLRMKTFLANSRLHDQTKTLSGQMKLQHEVNEMMRSCYRITSKKWLRNFCSVLLDENNEMLGHYDRSTLFSRILELAQIFWSSDTAAAAIIQRSKSSLIDRPMGDDEWAQSVFAVGTMLAEALHSDRLAESILL